ncbi:MAG: 50S ribosomal protein L29 [Candidatus Nomurabacteria bacterium]|nr:50S ribosomal protein L29 [Candidatus Nomurabacteria bacterium]
MAKKKENLKEETVDGLKEKLAKLAENLRVLRFNAQGSKSKNVKEQSSIKKNIAKILTQLNKNNTKTK